MEISNYPDLLKSAETTTGQLKQKSAWNSNYTEFIKNARNCKLKGKQKSAGNLNYTEFCLKIRKIVYLKVNQKSAGHSNTHNVKKCGKLQIEKQTQKVREIQA